MALTDILDKIEKETNLKLKEIEADFERKKAALEQAFDEKKESLDAKYKKSVEEKMASIMEKAKNLSLRESQNSLVLEKRKLIEECLDEAIEVLANSKDYEKYLISLLTKIPYEEGELISAKGKETALEKAMKATNKNYKILKETSPMKGGFIFRSRKIEIDNSIETIIKKQLKDDLEIKLNKLLFK
jgi:vacuolar-type H+-ATPase subunit E/Vma4